MSVELAAVVLAHDEERHIGACLDSLAWADRRVVIDDSSADRTVEIARTRGAEVIPHRMENFSVQRNAALDAVDAAWIFFVDADERATLALAAEARRAVADPRYAGWWVPRFNYFAGHRMRGGGWYPDHQLRLLCRGRARYDPARAVHEVALLDGEAGYLRTELLHYNYDSVAHFIRKQRRYAAYEAGILYERGVRARPWTYASMPLREFWRRFFTLRGYLDHVYGALFCGLMGYYTLAAYWRLRSLRRPER